MLFTAEPCLQPLNIHYKTTVLFCFMGTILYPTSLKIAMAISFFVCDSLLSPFEFSVGSFLKTNEQPQTWFGLAQQ